MRKKRYKLTAKVIYYIYGNIVILQPVAGLQIATNTVTDATSFFSLAT